MELKRLLVDGGACVNNLLMQTQADLLGVPVFRPEYVETTALGAAIAAGVGIGVWSQVRDTGRLGPRLAQVAARAKLAALGACGCADLSPTPACAMAGDALRRGWPRGRGRHHL